MSSSTPESQYPILGHWAVSVLVAWNSRIWHWFYIALFKNS